MEDWRNAWKAIIVASSLTISRPLRKWYALFCSFYLFRFIWILCWFLFAVTDLFLYSGTVITIHNGIENFLFSFLDFIGAFNNVFAPLHSKWHKRKVSLKTQLLYHRILINFSAECVSHVLLLLPVVVIAAEAAETEAWNHLGVEKFTAQWHPLCRWSSHFPGEFHAFRLYCIDFHAWNSLILKDNIMDAIWCKEWPIFNTGSLVGYSETARSRRLQRSVSLHWLSPASSSIIAVPDGWAEVFTKWHGPPCSFMVRGHLTMGSHFRWQQEDRLSRGFWDE